MNYYVIVLPMAMDGSVNRQIYAFTDFKSAKQAFHFNCGKYFNTETLKMASVCIIDDLANQLMTDSWQKPTEETPII